MAPRGEAVTTESAPGGHTGRVAALHHATEDHRSDHDRFVRFTTPRWERRRDTEHRLAHDVDAWVASASVDGVPYLVPLSFDWDGETLLVATPADSPTGGNLAATGATRLGLGPTRDVVMIEGEVEVLPIDALPRERGTGSPRAPASTRGRRPRRTAGSVSPRAVSRRGARRTS